MAVVAGIGLIDWLCSSGGADSAGCDRISKVQKRQRADRLPGERSIAVQALEEGVGMPLPRRRGRMSSKLHAAVERMKAD